MLGAICGDIIGSRFELHNIKTQEFELLNKDSCFTDDTVLTLAVCDAILYNDSPTSLFLYKKRAQEYALRYKQYYKRYPNAGFGQMFIDWANDTALKVQNSYGNGGAMRAVPIGWAYSSLEEVEKQAKLSCMYTHNNKAGIRGAVAVAGAVHMAGNRKSKTEIKSYLEKLGYKLNFTLDEIREEYVFDSYTDYSVPPAIEAFLESDSYEDAIRKAISIGGDSDTIACIAGGIAEAFYGGVPQNIASNCFNKLDIGMKKTVKEFESRYSWKGNN